MNDFKVDNGINILEKHIGLENNFFKNLLEESDWSFIIKLHSLIESIITSLLVFHFNESKLNKVFSQLELSNKITGKLAFIKEIDLLGKEDIRFIYTLSKLRNNFIHNVKNCNITLSDWIKKLDKKQLNNFAVFMRPMEAKLNNTSIIKRDKILLKQIEKKSLIDFARETPKLHIWLGAYCLLIDIIDSYYYSDYIQSIKAKDIFDDSREIFK